jgi:NADPH:quinone reductase-like Zn-dependent oxidoreductase
MLHGVLNHPGTSMKRIELSAPATLGGLRLVEIDPPRPAANELLVKIHASSLNFHDYLVATGVLPTAAGRVPLSDGVGEVIEAGSEVSEFVVGDRVLGTFFPDWIDGPPTAAKIARMRGDQVDGFASEYVALPPEAFTRVPAGLSDREAATLPCAGLTAWRALVVDGGLRPGETVLIEGTGGVSIFALQFAKIVGATVIAISSSEKKIARLRELGASHVINYTETPDWGNAVRAFTGGRGVDHVVEVVGGDLGQVTRALRVGGKIYMVGALSRKPIQFAAGALINGNAGVIGLTVGSRQHQDDMIRAIEASGLRPIVDRLFPFADIQQAFRHQEAKSHFGKICLAW